MQHSEQIDGLATALAKAQGEIQDAFKNAHNAHLKNSYADLASILKEVRAAFSKNGLSVTQFPSYEETNGVVTVATMLLHSSGQWMRGEISAPCEKRTAQAVGSATTYCRRYALAAIAGIAQDDDDGQDGQDASEASATQSQAPQRQTPVEHALGMKPAYPPEKFASNFPKWGEIVKSRKKTSEQIIVSLETMYGLTVAQKERILALDAPQLEGELV
jgi:hypothetical protein